MHICFLIDIRYIIIQLFTSLNDKPSFFYHSQLGQIQELPIYAVVHHFPYLLAEKTTKSWTSCISLLSSNIMDCLMNVTNIDFGKH